MVKLLFTYIFMLTIFTSCETQSYIGHVYIRQPCQWVHDPECGKCKELEKDTLSFGAPTDYPQTPKGPNGPSQPIEHIS